ncbi:MAG: polyphosphate kinase 1 [bacterium]
MATDKPHFINRELSWLEFDRRVLEEARDLDVPVLERLKFLAISASNLDEFFMVRVGGLWQLRRAGKNNRDDSGLSVEEQIDEIALRTHTFVTDQYACLAKDVLEPLAVEGVRILTMGQLSPEQNRHTERVFEQEIYPVVTPMAIRQPSDFPLLPGLGINICVRLAPPDDAHAEQRFAIIALPRTASRFIALPVKEGLQYILLEEVVRGFIERFFPGNTIAESVVFRITRNADLSVSEDLAGDLLGQMREVLEERKEGDCVRIEVSQGASKAMMAFFTGALGLEECMVYEVPGLVGLAAMSKLTSMPGNDKLRWESWPPQILQTLQSESIFDLLTRKDLLLYHPYESFDPVLQLVEQAADDPDVLAVKQILYRTSDNSPIVAALARAAERGKHVTAVVELKARFDEARNIQRALALERSGVHVIYGVKGLKTHAKACLVVRREASGIRRYVHFGTGNYNEATARLYSDVSYMTSREDYASDVSMFFNAITGYSTPVNYKKIDAAPLTLRARLLELIQGETQRVQQGQKGRIMAKFNSLTDSDLIEALYAASQAGVEIQLNVRGICCLRPGVPGLSEGITVVSIVDRFLEHSRILYFHRGGDPQVLISSADWMPRNLDRRIELLTAVEDPECRDRLIKILETCMQDNVKGRRLMPDGSYERIKPKSRKDLVRSQKVFHREARDSADQDEKMRQKVFEPVLPAKPVK